MTCKLQTHATALVIFNGDVWFLLKYTCIVSTVGNAVAGREFKEQVPVACKGELQEFPRVTNKIASVGLF